MIRPTGDQPPAGLSAARDLAALGAYLVLLVTINYIINNIIVSIDTRVPRAVQSLLS
jgi:hypothetical protein